MERSSQGGRNGRNGRKARSTRLLLGTGAALAVALWTLLALAAWWLLQSAAATLEGGATAPVMQAVTAWSERPWVRYWLDPQEALALRDGVDWLLGLGAASAGWLGSALLLLGAVIVLVWAGGLVLAAAGVLILFMLAQRLLAWSRSGWPRPWASPPVQPQAAEVHPAV